MAVWHLCSEMTACQHVLKSKSNFRQYYETLVKFSCVVTILVYLTTCCLCPWPVCVYVPVWQDILWNFSRLFFSFLSFATLICHSTGGHLTEPHRYPPFLSLSLSLPSHRLDTEGIELLLSFLKVSTLVVSHTQSYTLSQCVSVMSYSWTVPYSLLFSKKIFPSLFFLSTSLRNGFLLMIQWNTLTSRVWACACTCCLRVS